MDVDPGRAARAAIALSDGTVTIAPDGTEPGVFAVSSFSGDGTYRVQLGPGGGCTCADATFNGGVCKHRIALVIYLGLGGGS